MTRFKNLFRNKREHQIIVLAGLILACVVFLRMVSMVHAYVPFTAASFIQLKEKAKVGSVISFDNNSYRLSNKEFDSKMVGVLVEQADIVVEEGEPKEGDQLIITKGDAPIIVNGESGPIRPGEVLTSSATPGQAMKANVDGIAVAVALEAFNPKNEADTGVIRALIDVRFTTVGDSFSADSLGLTDTGMVSSIRKSVSELIGLGASGLGGTSPFFRYSLAVLVVAIAFVGGFLLFGRIALRGVEALGRNPLARKTIIFGIFINTVFTLMLVACAIALAYFIVVV